MDQRFIAPLILGIVLVFGVYRRLRRSFGPQRVSVARLGFRIGILAIAATLVLLASAHNINSAGALLGGAACGAALGYLGLLHTRFEATAQGRFYTPHTYIGLIVTALFLGRVVFRFLTLYSNPQQAAQMNQNPLSVYQGSPLTLAIFGVLIGYYLVFYIGVLRKTRDLAPLPAGPSNSASDPSSNP
jgi:hypothetical protein